MATQGTVLWKCGACEDCFCDLQAFANHKCLNNAGAALTDHCIKNLDESAFANAEIVNSSGDQVEVVSAVAGLEDNSCESIDQETTSFPVSTKRRRKAKPTIISINNSALSADKKFKKGKRSLVWTYFSALDHKKAMCCICHKVIAYCGTPTNLVYHLNRFHPTESEVVKSKQAGAAKYQYLQKKIPQLQSSQKFHVMPSKSANIVSAVGGGRKTLVDRIVDLLVLDLLPASWVQNQGFTQFLHSFEPTCQVPDAKKIMKDLLPERYYLESKKVKDELMSSDSVHLSLELWSGYKEGNFLTMTSHFYSDFNLKCYTLATASLGRAKDSQAVATSMLSCISDWGLTESVTCIVTNGSDCLEQAVSVAGKESIICLAHTLDAIIKEAFSTSLELNRLIDKCRKLVIFLKINDEAKQKLMETQTQDNQLKSLLRDHLEFSDSKTPNCPLKAKKDNAKYWITIFYMLQRIFTLRNVINLVLDEVPSNIPSFSENDWLAIEETISLLKAFEMVTLELCSEKFPPLSKVIPIVQGLLSLVTNCTNLTLTFIEKLRKNLLYRLQKKVGNVEENITLAVATVLDPRFKNIAFQSEDAVEAAVQEITCKGRKYSKQHLNHNSNSLMDTSSSSYTDSLWESFEKKAIPKKEASQSDDIVFAELKNFFDEPLLDRKKNPSIWWRDCGSARYPILTEIARSVLSIPATSVPPEQVFMQQEQPYLERRKNIKSKYVDHILFLNKNID